MSKKNNPNSPDNLLGKWFYEIETYEIDHDLIGSEQEYVLAKGALAHILDFSDQHNKLIEMYNWLISEQGNSFLSNNSRPSDFVYYELRTLSFEISFEQRINLDDCEDEANELREWIRENGCLLPSYLTLK